MDARAAKRRRTTSSLQHSPERADDGCISLEFCEAKLRKVKQRNGLTRTRTALAKARAHWSNIGAFTGASAMLHVLINSLRLRFLREGWTLSEQAPIAQAITCFACNGLPMDKKWFIRAGYHRHGQ
jgi:hypothetical protein